MNNTIENIKRIIILLGEGLDEIIVNIYLCEMEWNSIELYESGFKLNYWEYDEEYSMYYEDIDDESLEELLIQLENLI